MTCCSAGGSTTESLKESICPTLSAAPRSRHSVLASRSTFASVITRLPAAPSASWNPAPRRTAAAAAPAARPSPKPPKCIARVMGLVGTLPWTACAEGDG